MSDYITLAAVQAPASFEAELVQAPAFCELKRGDEVLLEGEDISFTVLASMTCSLSGEAYQFCLDAFDVTEGFVRKIRGKMELREFSYDNDGKSND